MVINITLMINIQPDNGSWNILKVLRANLVFKSGDIQLLNPVRAVIKFIIVGEPANLPVGEPRVTWFIKAGIHGMYKIKMVKPEMNICLKFLIYFFIKVNMNKNSKNNMKKLK